MNCHTWMTKTIQFLFFGADRKDRPLLLPWYGLTVAPLLLRKASG
jgi:hypothetical protein